MEYDYPAVADLAGFFWLLLIFLLSMVLLIKIISDGVSRLRQKKDILTTSPDKKPLPDQRSAAAQAGSTINNSFIEMHWRKDLSPSASQAQEALYHF